MINNENNTPMNISKEIVAEDVHRPARVMPNNIAQCGVGFEAAQKLNLIYHENWLKWNLLAEISQIRIDETVLLANIRIKEYEAKKIIDMKYAARVTSEDVHALTGEGIGTPTSIAKLHMLVQEFLAQKVVVKLRSKYSRDGFEYFNRNLGRNRYVATCKEDLIYDFDDYLIEKLGDMTYDINKSNKEDIFFRQLRKLPMVGEDGCMELPIHMVAFNNGFFNLLTQEFYPKNSEEKAFNFFSLDYPYISENGNPDGFDAMLADMFDQDQLKITLAYEVIGAILSNVNTLKKIFVFQGKSNGGKTRLTTIITELINDDDILSITTVSDITDHKINRDMRKCKLITINEGAEKSLTSKQVASLKAYADGSHGRQSTTFKMIIGTNHPITTDSSGGLDRGLFNRLAVLPFPKAMNNTDEKVAAYEDLYFDDEKAAIAKKALKAFSEVMKLGGKFSGEFPINECVEVSVGKEEAPRDKKIDIINFLRGHFYVNQEVTIDQWLTIEQINNELESFGIGRTENANLGRLLKKVFGDSLQDSLTSISEGQKKIYNMSLVK